VAEAFLLKGSPENLSWSLRDMKGRRSELLKGKPESWMVWGVSERFEWVLQRLEGREVFVYATRGAGIEGGLALYGIARGRAELGGKYWPQGERWLAFYLEVKKAAPGVLEYPENPKAWNLVPREKLVKSGIPVLPGPQKLKLEQAEKLKGLLEQHASESVECRLLVAGKQLNTQLTFEKLIELWRTGATKPFEEVRSVVEGELSSVELDRLAVYIKQRERVAVIEYSLKSGSGKVSAIIACAENPEAALKSFHELKESQAVELQSTDTWLIDAIKETTQNNYYNVEGVAELSEALREVADLASDVIDYYPHGDPRKVSELLVRSAFLFSIFHVIWPLSMGILVDLLVGNLPACFMQLRLLVETAAKALLVDHEMKFQDDVFTGVDELERSLRATSTSKVLRKLSDLKLADKEVVKDAVELWNKLSGEWAHFRGLFRRTEKALEKSGDLQSFRYVLPAELDERDAGDLKELAECVARARRLLRALYSSWLKLLEERLPEAASAFERR